MAGKRQRGAQSMKRARKSVSLLRQLSMTIEASGWGGRKREEETLNKNHITELFGLSPFPRTSDLSAIGMVSHAEWFQVIYKKNI